MLANWLEHYIFNIHLLENFPKIETNFKISFKGDGVTWEFDIIAGFETPKLKIPKLYNIEVKINGDMKGLLHQSLRNNANWFEYCFVATPLNIYFEYYQRELFNYYYSDFYNKIRLERKFHFGWIIFDFETERVWIAIPPKENKQILARKERNEIFSKLGFKGENLLLKGY